MQRPEELLLRSGSDLRWLHKEHRVVWSGNKDNIVWKGTQVKITPMTNSDEYPSCATEAFVKMIPAKPEKLNSEDRRPPRLRDNGAFKAVCRLRDDRVFQRDQELCFAPKPNWMYQ